MSRGPAAVRDLRRFLLEVTCRAPGCGRAAAIGAYCWAHGPEAADFASDRDPEGPPITAGDLLALLASRIGAEGPLLLHGEPVRLVLDGSDVRIYRKGATVWAGRLVAYPAALRVDASEAGKPYPCPVCGGAVMASHAQDPAVGDCPECGTALTLADGDGRPEGGPWRDSSRWVPRGK